MTSPRVVHTMDYGYTNLSACYRSSYSKSQEHFRSNCQKSKGRLHSSRSKSSRTLCSTKDYRSGTLSTKKGGISHSTRTKDKQFCRFKDLRYCSRSRNFEHLHRSTNEILYKPKYSCFYGKVSKTVSRTSPPVGNIYNLSCKIVNHFGHAKMIPFRPIQQELEDEIINYVHQVHDEIFECNGTELVEKKRKVMRLFDILYESFSKLEGNKSSQRIDLKAWDVLKSNRKLLKTPNTIGPVDGVEVGDRFDFRLQLVIMGIHSFIIRGIDYIRLAHGQLLATCVVATEGYFDKMVMREEILYTGEGGTFDAKGKDVKDQELKRGNMALKNSMDAGSCVRVVRGIKSSGKKSTTFIYDGLYKVVECYKERGSTGKMQLKFRLFRCPGQINIEWKRYY